MQCPICGADMQTTEQLDKYREVVKFDHCPHCGSFLLDHNQLDLLDCEVAEEIDGQGPVPVPAREKISNSAIDCPRCHIPMRSNIDHKNHDTPFRICPDCQSVLLEQGQLARFFGIMRKQPVAVPDQAGMFTRRDRILTSMISVMILLFGAGLAISKQTGYGSFSADSLVSSTGIAPKLFYAFIALTVIIFIIGLILSFSRQNKAVRLLGWSTILLSIALIFYLSV